MKIIDRATDLAGSTIGFLLIPLYLAIPIGDLYWLWMSIQLGSFWMFVVGLMPPFFIIAAPIGLWSLIFGPPQWVLRMFG